MSFSYNSTNFFEYANDYINKIPIWTPIQISKLSELVAKKKDLSKHILEIGHNPTESALQFV